MYKRQATVQRSYSAYLMYVAMFPQLVAGPIVRYVDIALQIDERQETLAGFAEGIKRFAIGKMCIRDSLSHPASVGKR